MTHFYSRVNEEVNFEKEMAIQQIDYSYDFKTINFFSMKCIFVHISVEYKLVELLI